MEKFKALVARENADGAFTKAIEQKAVNDLPDGEVLVQVKYAGLNYKDALSASGHKGISKNFPHTPGVDACGVIVESANPEFGGGEEVIVTGYDLGMNTSGGFQEYIRVPSSWIVPKPEHLSLREAMVYGTAGFTAALGLHKLLLAGQVPEMGEILVTGATGGVGSMAVGILSKAGFQVVASTGKGEEGKLHLQKLGVSRVEGREYASDESGKPLIRSRWAGAIDTVGGNTLSTCIRACKRHGSVVSCGLVSSAELHMTVYPFLLNGINLLGVDSAETEMGLRMQLWGKLAGEWKINDLESFGTFVPLEEIPGHMDRILQGQTKGRIVADFSL